MISESTWNEEEKKKKKGRNPQQIFFRSLVKNTLQGPLEFFSAPCRLFIQIGRYASNFFIAAKARAAVSFLLYDNQNHQGLSTLCWSQLQQL